MRPHALLTEAARNLAVGVTMWWLVAPLFILLVGGITVLDVSNAAGVLARAQRNAELGVNALKITGPVTGELCEAATLTERFRAAGAVRSVDPIHLRTEPGSPVAGFQITRGAAAFYGIEAPDAPGVFMSVGLWNELGRPGRAFLASGERADVAGTFDPPNHLTEFERLLIEIVPARGNFEACLVDRVVALPDDAQRLTAVIGSGSLEGTSILQLNSDLGRPIDGRTELHDRLARGVASWATLGGGALVAAFGAWLRRREIALARQLGASRVDVSTTHAVEALVWSVVASICVAALITAVVARDAAGSETRYLMTIASRDLTVGVLGAVLAGTIVAAAVRGTSVLRYLRDAG